MSWALARECSRKTSLVARVVLLLLWWPSTDIWGSRGREAGGNRVKVTMPGQQVRSMGQGSRIREERVRAAKVRAAGGALGTMLQVQGSKD